MTEPQPSFEQALAVLQTIVDDLEEGQLDLATALARYEQGVKLLRQCYALLENAERRIELVSRVDAQGDAVTQSFDEQSVPLEERAQTRGRRRSARPAASEPPCDDTEERNNMDEPRGLF